MDKKPTLSSSPPPPPHFRPSPGPAWVAATVQPRFAAGVQSRPGGGEEHGLGPRCRRPSPALLLGEPPQARCPAQPCAWLAAGSVLEDSAILMARGSRPPVSVSPAALGKTDVMNVAPKRAGRSGSQASGSLTRVCPAVIRAPDCAHTFLGLEGPVPLGAPPTGQFSCAQTPVVVLFSMDPSS